MLHLWIIDLREKTKRRDFFANLIAKIDHVSIANGESVQENCADSADAVQDEPVTEIPSCDAFSDNTDEVSAVHNVKELLEKQDRLEADRNSVIVGNYWRYSQMDNSHGLTFDYGNDANDDTVVTKKKEDIAHNLYEFQSELVAEGQAFIKELRSSNVHADIKINIVVLGDLTEEFTRMVFPAIAGILQKEKGRILPHHIHQGMEIIGMLFMPSDINTREVKIRKSMQRTLKEIDVQHCVNDVRGYDHVMFYQDVQNRTECAYSILNDEQVAQYLLQCIVHLYLACNDTHPLLSGTSSADVFYFSMGAASVFFDTEDEDLKSQHKLAVEFMRNLKSAGDDEKVSQSLSLLGENEYAPNSFFDVSAIYKIDGNEFDAPIPSPHPVKNFTAKYLKRYYYNLYLRFFTVNLLKKIVNQIEANTSAALEAIATNSKRRFSDVQKTIFNNLKNVIGQISANDGGLPTITRLFKELQGRMSDKKKDIHAFLEQKFWRQIEGTFISKTIRDKFMEYHDAYTADIKNKTGGAHQAEMKKQAITELNGILSQEATMLSRIGRSILLGVMCALALVPVFHLLSPHVINLGHVRRNGELWSICLFLLPALIQFLSYLRYCRKKKRAVNDVKAMYLHDAYARVSNRIESEISSFYDKMIALGDRYLARCEDIRKEIGKGYEEDAPVKSLFPESIFNQPLICGKFGNSALLPHREADDAEVNINYIRYKLSELTKTEHFMFINQHRDVVMELFCDVALCENLIRRVKDDGEEELVTKEQQEQEQKEAWEIHLKEFHTHLKQTVKGALLPRENSTVGEKLRHYCIMNPDKSAILKPMIDYAATNGEVTSSSDTEFTDAKMNEKRVCEIISPYISSTSVQMQDDKYNKIYMKYIFITRWRCFEHFNLNRILPTEDFDEKIRIQRVYEAEETASKEKKKKRVSFWGKEKVQNDSPSCTQYCPRPSSLLLWALCPDDSSSEWFRLFDSEFFAEAYADKNYYRKILNQND